MAEDARIMKPPTKARHRADKHKRKVGQFLQSNIHVFDITRVRTYADAALCHLIAW